MTIRISWRMLGLAAVFAAAVVAAILELGPPSSSARTAREVVTAERGVVQSTVTGTGNLEPSTDVEANFQTSGVLQHVYVKDGNHVVKGQLLATLDPTSDQLTVDQAQEQLTSAEDQLTNAENEKTASSSTAAADPAPAATTAFVSYRPNQTTTQTSTTPTRTGTSPTRTSTTPTRTATAPTTTTTVPTRTTTSPTRTSTTPSGGSGGSAASSSGSSNSSSQGTVSPATKAGDIASAQASVDSAEASLKTAENTLHQTHLYAPATGTVVSVASISPGDTVSGGSSSGSGSGSGSSSSATSATSASSGSGAGSTAGGLGGASSSAGSSSSSSSSSSSGLIEIVNTSAMTVSVPFSESDIGQIKVGQMANVTLEALTGVELAGHVSSISTLGTSSSGVVSYDATIAVDQHDSRVKPGMSVSVSVVTGQATGVNLPSSAVTGSSGSVSHVNVLKNGHTVSTAVVVGLVGTNRTQIVSGLRAGQQVVVTETLPALGTSSSSSGTGSTGTLGGGGLGGGGGFRRLLGGGGAFLGGGGGLPSGG